MIHGPIGHLSAAAAIAILLFSGCDGNATDSKNHIHGNDLKQERATVSTYITKGNFVQIAQFAYQKITDPASAAAAMPVIIPGGADDQISMQAYDVVATKKKGVLQKIRLFNYQETLEMKFVDGTVDIHYITNEQSIDRKIPFGEFVSDSKDAV